MLSIASFGDVQAGISFIMIAATLFTSLNTIALYSAAIRKNNSHNILESIERVIITLSACLAVIVLIFAPQISNLFNISSPTLLYILAAIFIINIPAATWVGALQGNGQFITSGFISVAASLIKLLASGLLIYAGFGAHGALIGMLIGFVIILPLAKYLSKAKTNSYLNTFKLPNKMDFVILYKDKASIVILLSMIIIYLVNTMDITFSKIFLDRATAGLLAQASTAAKIPFFALIPVTIIFFERFIKGEVPILRTIIWFTTGSFIVSYFVYLAGPFIMKFVFNSTYDHQVFPALLIAYSTFLCINMLSYAIIARRNIIILLLSSISSLGIIILLLINSQKTISSIASTFMYGMLIACAIFCFAYVFSYLLHQRKSNV